MQKESKTLHLFTAEFPFGNKSETFLETEILFLSKEFNRVIVYPSVKKEDIVRRLPSNVKVNSVLINESISKRDKILILIKKCATVRSIIYSEIKDKGFNKVLKNRKILFDYLSQQLMRSGKLEKEIGFKKTDVFYDYWFIDSLLALTILKKKGLINAINARGHRFDIYDDCHNEIGVPFRNWKMKSISKLFLISQHGFDYLTSKLELKFHSKLFLSRLGVIKNQNDVDKIKMDKKLIVSCSSINDFKQVHLIAELLKEIPTNFHWVHFGDGPELHRVKNALKNKPSNFTVELKGHVDNSEVIKFYKNHEVDLFISTSRSEGLPVSMMEAQSFGIPIVSFPIGGIPEIVKDKLTGFLLSNERSNNISIIKKALEYQFSKPEIVAYFNAHFNAVVNYAEFVKLIR